MATEIQNTINDACAQVKFLMQKKLSADITEQLFNKLQQSNQEILQHVDDMQEVYESLEDAKSKQQYLNFLKYQFLSKLDRKLALSFNPNMPIGKYQAVKDNLEMVIKQKGLKNFVIFLILLFSNLALSSISTHHMYYLNQVISLSTAVLALVIQPCGPHKKVLKSTPLNLLVTSTKV